MKRLCLGPSPSLSDLRMKTVQKRNGPIGDRALFDAFLQIKTGKHETALFGAEPLFNLLTNENGDK